MPYTNKRNGVYVTNGTAGTYAHGVPVVVSGLAGIAIKQKARAWSDGLSNQAKIDANEVFLLQTHGEIQVGTATGEAANGVTWAVGDLAYAATTATVASGVSTHAVTKTNTGTPLGRVTETPTSPSINSTSRVPANKIRIDLDLKV